MLGLSHQQQALRQIMTALLDTHLTEDQLQTRLGQLGECLYAVSDFNLKGNAWV